MVHSHKRFAIAAAPLLLGLGLAGATIGSGTAGPAAAGPLRCEIAATKANGMVTLEGVLRADQPVTGSYTFRVTGAGGGGSTNIAQGGGFMAGPEGPVSLGQVMLGGGSAYDASLEVSAGGATVTCSERVGGAI